MKSPISSIRFEIVPKYYKKKKILFLLCICFISLFFVLVFLSLTDGFQYFLCTTYAIAPTDAITERIGIIGDVVGLGVAVWVV